MSDKGRPPFVIFALPRSRTFWLSRFLSYGGWACGHDEARHIRGIDDVRSWLSQDCVGTVETAAAPFWRLLTAIRPDAHVAVVRRSLEDVARSLTALKIPFDGQKLRRNLGRLDRKLDQIERRVSGVLSIRYEELGAEAGCARLFEHCLSYPHDSAWWQRMCAANLQIDLAGLLRYEVAHAGQLRRAESICAQEIRSILWRSRKPADLDGMTIQEEPFETFWRDGQKLFAQHCVEVGEPADQYLRKNLPLMRRLDAAGALQIITARCNGRMFGYLATILGPSLELEDTDLGVATQTTFYASPDARGLGLRLQRASVNALAARGGNWDVIQRAGVRGSGQKLGALYRRMGAEDYGHLHKISLRVA